MPKRKVLGAFPVERPVGSFPSLDDVVDLAPLSTNRLQRLIKICPSIYPINDSPKKAILPSKRKHSKTDSETDMIPLLESVDHDITFIVTDLRDGFIFDPFCATRRSN
jgi:hypothetical protein